MHHPLTTSFVIESNKIEGIVRPPTVLELEATERFWSLDMITMEDLQEFVSAVQPNAVIRDKDNLNVRVGKHHPPSGGYHICVALSMLLEQINSGRLTPYEAHCAYELLHPFTDGNGRSGRVLWYWHMTKSKEYIHENLGFLHAWYYQSLQHYPEEGAHEI